MPIHLRRRPTARDAGITLDHLVLEVRDVEATARFYESLLGLEPLRLDEWRAGTAPFVSGRISAETIIDYFPPRLWANRRRARNPVHVCFTLTRQGVAALRRRLKRRGIALLSESGRNFGARGWGASLYFADPDGITIEARYYPAAR